MLLWILSRRPTCSLSLLRTILDSTEVGRIEIGIERRGTELELPRRPLQGTEGSLLLLVRLVPTSSTAHIHHGLLS